MQRFSHCCCCQVRYSFRCRLRPSNAGRSWRSSEARGPFSNTSPLPPSPLEALDPLRKEILTLQPALFRPDRFQAHSWIGKCSRRKTHGERRGSSTAKADEDVGSSVGRAIAMGGCGATRDESLPRHRRGVTDPQSLETRHDLSCTALTHTEELLDRQAVELSECHGTQGAEDFVKSMKPGRVGRAWGKLLLYYTLGSDPALWPSKPKGNLSAIPAALSRSRGARSPAGP